ncbi:hypothetical protein R1flu_014899 [Riccia fluitans]|uniref:ATP-dependent RNA helicase n=1 Tax=Riccia fluitans TaxID=41844 RepID=A0ABD1YHD6_9MARC
MAGSDGLMMHRLAMTRPLTLDTFCDSEVIEVIGSGSSGNIAFGVRIIDGGRTFPGDVSKWQWKRMQEKKERQIEKARLLRERQAYEERKRQELLASSNSGIPVIGSYSSDAEILKLFFPESTIAGMGRPMNTLWFDEFPISPLSIRALHEIMGYQKMTKVQEATFPVILEGKDVLAKAKTGTGKTIAFLLPSIEAILKATASSDLRWGRCPVHVLIICPTREPATQAATEAKTLLTYHKRMDAQIVVGGTNNNTEANNLQKNPCQVLVATPGRLLDHMSSSKEVVMQLSKLKMLVLDEADRLLDMGFKTDLDRLIKQLPASRQILLFCATVPKEVHEVSHDALKEVHVFIDTVGKDEEKTHAKVEQSYIISPLDNQLEVVLVFCTTARVTALMAEWSQNLGWVVHQDVKITFTDWDERDVLARRVRVSLCWLHGRNRFCVL